MTDLDLGSVGDSTVMTTLRPAEALVAGLPAPLPDGLNGDISCVRACLARQGVEVPSAELYGVSGAAFRAYFYRRKDNPECAADPDWCWTSEVFSSRDGFASIAEYCGAAIERKLDLDPDPAWLLIETELALGRPVVSYGIAGPFEPVIVTGYRRAGRRTLRVQSKFLAARDAEVDITGLDNWAGEGAPLRNPVVTVRAGAAPRADYARRAALRTDACRWAVEHARAGRERLETQKLYAAGPQAFEAFADFLAGAGSGLSESLGREGEADEVALFIAVMAAEWRRARLAAATFFDLWAFECDELGQFAPRPPGGVPGLRRAAARYRAVAEALEGFAEALPAPWSAAEGAALEAVRDGARRARAAAVLRAARNEEAKVVEAIAALLAPPAPPAAAGA